MNELEALSRATWERQRYNDLMDLVISSAREYRRLREPDLLDWVHELDAIRRRAFDSMNATMRDAHIGEFPWTTLDQVMSMLEAEDELGPG